jgi:hypothetical protein
MVWGYVSAPTHRSRGRYSPFLCVPPTRIGHQLSEVSVREAGRLNLKQVRPGYTLGPPKNGRARYTLLLPSVANLLGSPGEANEYGFSVKPQRVVTDGHHRFIRWEYLRRRVWDPAVAKACELDPKFQGRTWISRPQAHLCVDRLQRAPPQLPPDRRNVRAPGHSDDAQRLHPRLAGWDEQLAERFDDVRRRAKLRLVDGEPRSGAKPRPVSVLTWGSQWRGRCPVSGDPGHLSRDIADTTMKDRAHGSGWLCHQRRAGRGPQRQRRVRSPRHLPQLAVRAARPLPPGRRRRAHAPIETASLVADAGGGGHGGRDRGPAQGAVRAGGRRRRPHHPLPPAATSPAS